jgi:hypothetical protein
MKLCQEFKELRDSSIGVLAIYFWEQLRIPMTLR